MAKKQRLVKRGKTTDALGVLGGTAGTIAVHRNDLKGPIYAAVLTREEPPLSEDGARRARWCLNPSS